MMALHGLDESGAVRRMEAEGLAAEVYFRVRRADLPGYAGAWFDSDSLRLHVASRDPEDADSIRRLGAVPLEAARSLADLEVVRERIEAQLRGNNDLVSSRVDVRANELVVSVLERSLDDVQAALSGQSGVRLEAVTDRPRFSSGPLRGGVPTRNQTWITHYAHPGVCSVGVAVERGFLTAGHCTFGNNPDHGNEDIRSAALSPLGLAQASTMVLGSNAFLHNRDAAWVQTVAGWSPVPEIDGYAAGILTVPAEWSGKLDVPVNATVCRYGGTSGGPYCGTVGAKNVSVWFGTWDPVLIEGLTLVEASCTDDGDSGGPHVALANGQVQGIDVGGWPTENCRDFPTTAGVVYFQPVSDGLNLLGLTMLTSHGASPATVQDLHCEGTGWSSFFCWFDSYRSQGPTTWAWQSSQGGSGSGAFFSGSCTAGTWPVIGLSLTNPYGSSVPTASFFCNGGPPM